MPTHELSRDVGLRHASGVLLCAGPHSFSIPACVGAGVWPKQVRRFAFDSICKVASLYYQHLTPYMDALFRLTTASVDREEEVAVRAIEFWNVICEVRNPDSYPLLAARVPWEGAVGHLGALPPGFALACRWRSPS